MIEQLRLQDKELLSRSRVRGQADKGVPARSWEGRAREDASSLIVVRPSDLQQKQTMRLNFVSEASRRTAVRASTPVQVTQVD